MSTPSRIGPLGLLLLAACAPHTAATGVTPRFFVAPDSTMRTLPFSEAVQVGDLLFLSGQIGVSPETLELVPGGIEPEATQALENIKGVLARHGSSLARVVKCTVFLADIKDWPAFNDVYRRFFTAPYPARSAFGANGLARGARVEVDCIAAR
ncbi:MAG TPA: Rid family detoxifying hydrolase [Gemmatimonadales bacterium]|nr:Rid family detoxifying hydrolase [Gemmatimonadales bacterium]